MLVEIRVGRHHELSGHLRHQYTYPASRNRNESSSVCTIPLINYKHTIRQNGQASCMHDILIGTYQQHN